MLDDDTTRGGPPDSFADRQGSPGSPDGRSAGSASGSDARSGLGLDGVALDRYFISAFMVRQLSVVWVVYAFEEDALLGRLSPYLLQPLHPLWRYVAAHIGEQLTRLPFAALIAAVFFAVRRHKPKAF